MDSGFGGMTERTNGVLKTPGDFEVVGVTR